MHRGRSLPLVLVFFSAPALAQEGMEGARALLNNIDARIVQVEREVQNPVAQSRYYSIERRLVDAEVYFELENYPKSAVLYLDATMNAAFPTHPERVEILYQLGYSLLQIKNFLGAREALELAVAAGMSPHYDKSLRYLIEIGLMTRSGAGLEAAVEKVSRLSNLGPETLYAYGKGLSRLGRTREAITALSQVPPTAAEYGPSQYYLGVALTEQELWADALTTFQRSLAATSQDPVRAPVSELARLAVARLQLQLGRYEAAIEQYQELPRSSEHFHRALYEMTWAYVDSEQLDKALNALDLLLLSVEDDNLATEAQILRGRLSMEMDRADAAEDAYAEVLERFEPLRQEIDTFSKDKEALKKYFRWLLDRHQSAFLSRDLLSERAMTWIESDPQLRVLVGLFDDMSVQKSEMGEANAILKEIDSALASESRLESFPNLRSAWTRSLLAKNELVDVSHIAIVAKETAAKARLSGSSLGSLQTLIKAREDAEAAFASAPRTSAQYEQRVTRDRDLVSDERRECFVVEQLVKDLGVELKAIERWVTDTPYRDSESAKDAPAGTGAPATTELVRIRAELDAGRKRYASLQERVQTMKERLDRAHTSVGAGDTIDRSQDAQRAAVLAAHARIEAVTDAGARDTAEATELRQRALASLSRLERVTTTIDSTAAGKAGEFHGELEAERKLLDGYARQIAVFARDSDKMARDVGGPLFRDAKGRLDDVVLEADMGTVDIGWKRKQRESERIAELQKERAAALQQIEAALEGVRKPQ